MRDLIFLTGGGPSVVMAKIGYTTGNRKVQSSSRTTDAIITEEPDRGAGGEGRIAVPSFQSERKVKKEDPGDIDGW